MSELPLLRTTGWVLLGENDPYVREQEWRFCKNDCAMARLRVIVLEAKAPI
jgi:hypothetical protein